MKKQKGRMHKSLAICKRRVAEVEKQQSFMLKPGEALAIEPGLNVMNTGTATIYLGKNERRLLT
jgi:hypothetical protein